MATSEQIRKRIVELVKKNEFTKEDLLNSISHCVHDGVINNNDIIEIVKHLVNDILNAQTRVSYKNLHNKGSYNAHQFAKGERFELRGIEFICDNK